MENSRRKADWALVIPVTWKGLPRCHWWWRARPRAQETREGGPGSGRPSTRETGGSGSGRPSTRETGWIPGREDPPPETGGPGSGRPPEEGLATRCRICLENPRMEEPGGGSPRCRREWDPTERLSAHARCERCWNPLSPCPDLSGLCSLVTGSAPGPPDNWPGRFLLLGPRSSALSTDCSHWCAITSCDPGHLVN